MTELPPPPDRDNDPDPRLRLRILFGDSAMLGPGKAELLDRIAETCLLYTSPSPRD